jgi:hypothetical protein
MFIESSEVIKNNEKNYLRVFLSKDYLYSTRIDGNDVEMSELLFEEPSVNDISELKKLGVAIEKLASYDSVKSIRTANMFTKDQLEAIRSIQQKEQEEIVQNPEKEEVIEEENEEDNINKSRFFMSDLLIRSGDFDNDDSNYYQELDKFIQFINKKCKKDINGVFLQNDLNVLDKYKAKSIFIKESLVIEYVAFFFAHLPSRSLHMNLI